MKLSEAKVNVAVQEEGDWVDNIPELPGVRIKTRGANNRAWRRMSTRLYDSIPRSKRIGGRVEPETMDGIMTNLLVECGTLDWDGLQNDDGTPLTYSKE